MKVLIIGAGRMGVRHAQGVALIDEISEIYLADINEQTLQAAKEGFNDAKPGIMHFLSLDELNKLQLSNSKKFDIVIIATTSKQRFQTIKFAVLFEPKYMLVEKPIEQDIATVKEIETFFVQEHPDIKVYVNFSTRLIPDILNLKKDLNTLKQMDGPKTISINTGALGIGSNGIHYLDLIFFLLNADKATIAAAEIDKTIIPSGRGKDFLDFGGWAVINFFNNEDLPLGKALLSLSSNSTVVSPVEIVGPHGRILYDLMRETRLDILRKADSDLPVYRYNGDYMPEVLHKLDSYTLADLTKIWVEGILENKDLLPQLSESLKPHELMFDWLNYSKDYKDKFSIT